MTLDTALSKALYQGNGSATQFPFAFKVWKPDQIRVTVTGPGRESRDVTSQSRIELTKDGGVVTYPLAGEALSDKYFLSLTRNMPFVQDIDLVSGSKFDVKVMETGMDQSAAERQQLREQLDRAVILPPTSEQSPEEVVEDIYAARDEAQASAEAAAQSATAAEKSAVDAAASESHAKEYQDWSCQCADRAEQARNVALAQAVATNELMVAETSKINAIVVANKDDQQAAIARAKAWADSDMPPDPDDPESKSAKTWAKVAEENVTENLPTTSKTQKGVMQVGDNLDVTAQGVVSVPLAEKDKPGLIRPDGANLDVISGLLNLSAKLQAELAEQEFLRKLRIGCPKFWRSTTLPANHAWPDGSFVEFEDWPEFYEIYEQGGFTGLVMPWDADAEYQAAHLGQFRPNAANPTGLYIPLHGGQFFQSWVLGQVREAGSWQEDALQGHVHGYGGATDRSNYSGSPVMLSVLPIGNNSTVSMTNAQKQVYASDGAHGTPRIASNTHPENIVVPVIFYLGRPK